MAISDQYFLYSIRHFKHHLEALSSCECALELKFKFEASIFVVVVELADIRFSFVGHVLLYTKSTQNQGSPKRLCENRSMEPFFAWIPRFDRGMTGCERSGNDRELANTHQGRGIKVGVFPIKGEESYIVRLPRRSVSYSRAI
jgi:hypothetical protein